MFSKYKLLILFVLAICVLISYYIVFIKLFKSNKTYINHEFWFGIDKTIVKILVFFQLLAVFGFIISVYNLIINIPNQGILSKYLFEILFVFFISSIVWPFATFYKKHSLVIVSLIFAAISSILLLAGSVEDNNSKWYVILGLFFLSIVTVLGDSVIWNANYIYKNNLFLVALS